MNKVELASVAILSALIFRTDALLAFSTGQAASYVVGQPTFDTNAVALTQNGMNVADRIAIDPVYNRLFVADMNNNRVMVYDLNQPLCDGTSPNSACSMNATHVLGQPDFVSGSASPPTRTGLSHPVALVYDSAHTLLFVSDSYNRRVLVFNMHPSTLVNNMPAAYVLGQPDFITNGGGVAPQSRLTDPDNMGYDAVNNRLFVPDQFNHRVMVFDLSAPMCNVTGPGLCPTPAWGVLGQAVWTTYGSGRSKSAMNRPAAAAYDPVNNRIFISENNNERVLMFALNSNAICRPGIGGQCPTDASRVLGKPGFTTAPGSFCSANSLASADDVSYDTTTARLFVGDHNNHRVMVFNAAPGTIANGMNASYVLGQPNFTSCDGRTSQSGMNRPSGAVYDSVTARIFVADENNHRITIFEEPPPCGSLSICGFVRGAESPSPGLAGIPIELRDSRGGLITTKKSGAGGAYSFVAGDGLTENESYSVAPVVGRMNSVAPLHIPIISLPATGTQAHFKVRGWPGRFQVGSAPPNSFILISTSSYAGAGADIPPTIAASNSASTSYYSTVSKLNNTALARVPAGSSYYLTCWLAEAAGAAVSYRRSPASGSQGPYTITASEEVTLACAP